jgi:hypothetical protein
MRGLRHPPRLPLLALMLVAPMLAGCAQGPTLQERLQRHVGQSELELVTALGVPVRTYDVEGRRFLQYEQRRTVFYAEPAAFRPPAYGPWGPRWGWSPAAVPATVECDVTFELREGRVTGFSYRGQGCG